MNQIKKVLLVSITILSVISCCKDDSLSWKETLTTKLNLLSSELA